MVTTRTMLAVPITTPSVVSDAFSLLARRASRAACQVSTSIKVVIQIGGRRPRATVAPRGPVSDWGRAQARRDIHRQPLSCFQGAGSDDRAIRAPQRAKEGRSGAARLPHTSART